MLSDNSDNKFKKYKNEKSKSKNKKGGEVIASGGFGCVFSPALICEGSKKRETGKITKLMKERYALDEYEEISKFKNKLDDIKDYKNYFLIDDITLCKPAKLSKQDLTNYSKKCGALPKDKITKTNINKNLNKVMALNIPDGGIPVDDYIYNNGSFQKMFNLNDKLKQLLKNGIIPMNERNIYHCDLKDSNILVKEFDDTIKTRIIDWGLATEYIPHKDEPFPTTWRNRPLQFNVPFSVIIFTDAFVQQYTEHINNDGKLDETNIKPFVLNYLHFWIQERGPGHYKFINDIMFMLFGNELTTLTEKDKLSIIENEFTITYIVNYITEILIHFTKFRDNDTLNLREYLDNVFIKIVDVWGFISTYFPFLELLYANYDKLSEKQLKVFDSIKKMFIDYLYKPRIKPIHIQELCKYLDNLGKLINDVINEEKLANSPSAKGVKQTKTSRKETSIKNTKNRMFKRVPKSKTRKFKNNKLVMISLKLKKNN
jgi:serine/threonine protein kinase